jgi:hypothetical protein
MPTPSEIKQLVESGALSPETARRMAPDVQQLKREADEAFARVEAGGADPGEWELADEAYRRAAHGTEYAPPTHSIVTGKEYGNTPSLKKQADDTFARVEAGQADPGEWEMADEAYRRAALGDEYMAPTHSIVTGQRYGAGDEPAQPVVAQPRLPPSPVAANLRPMDRYDQIAQSVLARRVKA